VFDIKEKKTLLAWLSRREQCKVHVNVILMLNLLLLLENERFALYMVSKFCVIQITKQKSFTARPTQP